MEEILNAIKLERNRQDDKWGEQFHHPIMWCAILGEEVGEVNKAALEENWEEYRKELIQVAAVAVAMLECENKPF